MLAAELPLKDRQLICTSTFSWGTIRTATTPKRPVKYESWNESHLYSAYLAHVKEGMSVRRAAEAYGVPKSTLQDRVIGKVCFSAKSGPSKFLTDEEESELVNFLCGCAAVVYAKSKQQVLCIVRTIVRSKGIDCLKVPW